MAKYWGRILVLGGLAGLGSCEPSVSNELGGPVEIAQDAPASHVPAQTKAAALSVIIGNLGGAHKLQFYKLDSAQVSDQGRYWRVLVPRVDSVSRMLIQLDVEKATSYMSSTRLSYRALNQ